MHLAICTSPTCEFEGPARPGDRYCPWCAQDVRVLEESIPGKPNANARASGHVAAPTTHLIKPNLRGEYPRVTYGRGVYLYDDRGRRYLDACSGAIAANIGHAVPEITRAMQEQASRVSFVYRTQFTSEPAERLAARLADLAPGDLNRVFFVNSGSEGTETALRLAVQYWRERGRRRKTRLISRHMSYHGMTLGALSMSGHPDRRSGYEEMLHNYPEVPAADCRRCPLRLKPETCELACALEWERALERHDPETVAAVIAEPVVGAAGGAIPAPPGYFRKLREICDRHEVLLIADEVMTGLGRTGAWFACEHEGIVPDLLVVGKGLNAGYTPMSAVLVRAPLVEAMAAGSGSGCFGHTLSANPLSAAICLAVLDYLERHDLIRAARERGDELRRGLEGLAARHRVIGDVRGRGLLLGLELLPRRRNTWPKESAAARLVEEAFRRGLIIYPAGSSDDTDAVLIAPPLTITSQEIDLLISLLEATLRCLDDDVAAPSNPRGN